MTGRGKTTRQEKIARIGELREQGLAMWQIAEEMGYSESWVRDLWYDQDRKKTNKRRRRYFGVCVDCGGATKSYGGPDPAKATKRCAKCHRRHQTKHTRRSIVKALREFYKQEGRTPYGSEMGSGHEPAHPRDPRLPHYNTIRKRYGSFEAACKAAKIPHRGAGKRTE